MTIIKRKKIQEALYYTTILLTIIFISSALFLLSPLIVLNNPFLNATVLIILGIALGAFLQGFLKDLDELTHAHHVSIMIIVLLASAINFFSITLSFTIISNKAIPLAMLNATIFTMSFLIPYIYKIHKIHKK